MRYVRIDRPGGSCWGVIKGEDVLTLTKPPHEKLDYDGGKLPLRQCRLLAPCEPTKIVCVGKNYADHAREMGGDPPGHPILFLKGLNTLNRPDGAVHAPEFVGRLDYEGELGIVIRDVTCRVTPEQAKKTLSQANYFGTMLVKMGEAHALLGGATYSTADTVRPALQLIKTKPGNKIVSSCFILVRPFATGGNQVLAMGDCAINIDPSEDDLVEITQEVAQCARRFGAEPRVAMLSYSTMGSGAGPMVDKMRNACKKLQALDLDYPVDGEFQFDAAVSPTVGHLKAPKSHVAGRANTFIFPDISSGNIGYKIAQRMGNFDAYGPILLGLNAPINDLSRGCNALEVYSMSIITAALAD